MNTGYSPTLDSEKSPSVIVAITRRHTLISATLIFF